MKTQRLESAYPGQHVCNADEFIFLSAHCGIRARGVFERLSTPLEARGAAGEGPFQRHLTEVMNRARASGIANPLVLGAIPFDKTEPCSLTIPRSYEMFSRSLEAGAGYRGVDLTAAKRKPVLVGRHSLPDEQRFKQSVNQAIANFQLSDIRKAVLSRILELEFDTAPRPAEVFGRLLAGNASGYHFCLPLEDGSTLLGVSPELLLRKQGRHIYSNPLAGSARRLPDAEKDRRVAEALAASDKDCYEHRLVIEDIRRQLQPFCETLDIPEAPSLMHTATMWHLSTEINGQVGDPAIGSLQLAGRLHPTPAVCGFPTGEARKLINLVEPHQRGLFAGMVGWCDAQGNGEWVVTIRCGRLNGCRVQVFAGAGIVGESDAAAEWAETEAKMQTMLRALDLHEQAKSASRNTATTEVQS